MQNKQAKNIMTETANRKKVRCAFPTHFSLTQILKNTTERKLNKVFKI